MVACGEELSTWVWQDGLTDKQVSVQSWGQVGGQGQPERVDVTDEKNKRIKYF